MRQKVISIVLCMMLMMLSLNVGAASYRINITKPYNYSSVYTDETDGKYIEWESNASSFLVTIKNTSKNYYVCERTSTNDKSIRVGKLDAGNYKIGVAMVIGNVERWAYLNITVKERPAPKVNYRLNIISPANNSTFYVSETMGKKIEWESNASNFLVTIKNNTTNRYAYKREVTTEKYFQVMALDPGNYKIGVAMVVNGRESWAYTYITVKEETISASKSKVWYPYTSGVWEAKKYPPKTLEGANRVKYYDKIVYIRKEDLEEMLLDNFNDYWDSLLEGKVKSSLIESSIKNLHPVVMTIFKVVDGMQAVKDFSNSIYKEGKGRDALNNGYGIKFTSYYYYDINEYGRFYKSYGGVETEYWDGKVVTDPDGHSGKFTELYAGYSKEIPAQD